MMPTTDDDIAFERRVMERYLESLKEAKTGTIIRSSLILLGIGLLPFSSGIEHHTLITICLAYEMACFIRVSEMLETLFLLDEARYRKMKRFFKIGHIVRVMGIIAISVVLGRMQGDDPASIFLILSVVYYEIVYSHRVRDQLALRKP